MSVWDVETDGRLALGKSGSEDWCKLESNRVQVMKPHLEGRSGRRVIIQRILNISNHSSNNIHIQ